MAKVPILSKPPKDGCTSPMGVRACAAGLRYVLYLYMTSLEDPTKVIAEPGGFLLAPTGEERIGDVSNVLFSNGVDCRRGRNSVYLLRIFRYPHAREQLPP